MKKVKGSQLKGKKEYCCGKIMQSEGSLNLCGGLIGFDERGLCDDCYNKLKNNKPKQEMKNMEEKYKKVRVIGIKSNSEFCSRALQWE